MNLDRTIYRHSVFFFAFIAIAAFFAFLPNYLLDLSDSNLPVHIHGVLLSLWILLLVSQAYLIRSNHRSNHRALGKFSFVLAPFVLVSIATIRHNAMSNAEDPFAANQMALFFPNAVTQPLIFAATFGLAMYYRHDRGAHARFMLCTLIPAAGPIFNRVMSFYVTDGIRWAPYTNNFVLASLVGLSIWDWAVHRRLDVFPLVLVLLVALRIVGALLSGSDVEMDFARWYLSLPLSPRDGE